jgi:Ca-activated chloride channel family protein
MQAAKPCELELVLAVDSSGSINRREYKLQMRGLADAFRSTDIIHLIASTSRRGDVFMTVMHWSGEPHQAQIVPWTRLHDEPSVLAFADAIDASPRQFLNYSTAIGNALEFSRGLFTIRPNTCRRRVIDVSGDGPNNEGQDVGPIRATLVSEGVTINGLVVIGDEENLDDYYRFEVIGGNGAFLMTANTFDDYPDAIRRKLLREIAPPITHVPQPALKHSAIFGNCQGTPC